MLSDEFNNFQPRLKDRLCELYKYCIKHGIEMSVDPIRMASKATGLVMYSEKAALKFINNIDQVKSLYDQVPLTRIKFNVWDDTDGIIDSFTKEVRTYSKEKAHKLITWNTTHSHKFGSFEINQLGISR
jgi:hypothetical protein